MDEHFDAVVIGAGAGGESVAWRLAGRGKRVALIERSLIGGECTYWACIPSKTLLHPVGVRAEARRGYGTGDVAIDWEAVSAYRDYMTRDWDDSRQVREYQEMGVAVFKTEARIEGPGVVIAGETELRTRNIVVATGGDPFVPPIEGLAESGHWGTHEVTSMKRVPESVAVVGGGPASIELGQMLARYGSAVALITRQSRLFANEDIRVGDMLADALEADGVGLRFGAQVRRVSRTAGGKRLELDDGSTVEAAELLVATGKRARVSGYGLETLGIENAERGIPIDEHGRAGEGVWAVGDVTGVAMLTHVAKYQGRLVADGIVGEERTLDYRAVPRVVFSDPEIAFVGVSAEEAARKEMDVVASTVEMSSLGRPYIQERDARGFLTLVADANTRAIVGATAVAPLSGEWIHLAALAVREGISAESLFETIIQFPTYSEAYISAAEELRRPPSPRRRS
ncbi:MAG: NAD(P)/FAD-dependent oxidoreductase [Coriobacteriia bacterium]|nr:NAD(P)/FAD-dependent oxidoreductase [Coriobacteriia bacterium]